MRAVGAYKRLSSSVTSTACLTQDAARRVSLACFASSRVSGRFLSISQLDLDLKPQATVAIVDATLFSVQVIFGAPLSVGPARRLEAVRVRWLRKLVFIVGL